MIEKINLEDMRDEIGEESVWDDIRALHDLLVDTIGPKLNELVEVVNSKLVEKGR